MRLHERLTERFVDRRTSVLMRRLRENTVLETDISKTGEVVVEGHAIGRLDGFRFTPDASTAGSEAKALAGAAQKALAGEIDARATRLAQAADGQFVLATDGTIRWLGQPVGKLVAGEEALKPRVRIIADEHLTGAPRDAVQARLDLWLKSHIERLLEPLFRLAAADDITGIARGVAFQLTEALGVLDRQKVAEEVKGLDQPARATLRKYGVRFGAYHIYVPALLKPAPRVLATQLWALKHGGSGDQGARRDRAARRQRPHLDRRRSRTSPRCSTAPPAIASAASARCASIFWNGSPISSVRRWPGGPVRPASSRTGAIDGFGFTVTVGMTSLAGCSGEDFASVLRSLGYRMEKRPKPAEPPPRGGRHELAATAPLGSRPRKPSPAASRGAGDWLAPKKPLQPRLQTSRPQHRAGRRPTAMPDAVAGRSDGRDGGPRPTAPVDARGASRRLAEPTAEAVTAFPSAGRRSPPSRRKRCAESRTDRQPQQPPEAASERSRRRPRSSSRSGGRAAATTMPRKPRHDSAAAPAPAAATARHGDACGGPSDGTAVAVDADGCSAARGGRAPRPPTASATSAATASRQRDASGSGDATPAPIARSVSRGRIASRARRAHDRSGRAGRPPRRERADRPPRGDRPDRDPTLRAKYIKGRGEGRDRRDREPDPNSPFAKLAALKEQLEANTKEPR